MNRGKNPSFSIPHSVVNFYGAVIGVGAGAPTRALDGPMGSTVATYPTRANSVSKVTAPTRTSAGVYVISIDHQAPTMLFCTAAVYSAGGSPTGGLSADVTVMTPVVKDTNGSLITIQVTVSTLTTGAATDIGTSDLLVFRFDAQDSTV